MYRHIAFADFYSWLEARWMDGTSEMAARMPIRNRPRLAKVQHTHIAVCSFFFSFFFLKVIESQSVFFILSAVEHIESLGPASLLDFFHSFSSLPLFVFNQIERNEDILQCNAFHTQITLISVFCMRSMPMAPSALCIGRALCENNARQFETIAGRFSLDSAIVVGAFQTKRVWDMGFWSGASGILRVFKPFSYWKRKKEKL